MSISGPVVSSIAELSDAIRARQLSSLEATDAMLARIEALNPTLHAFVAVTADQAREAALRADRDLAKGHQRGPLHGVPIALSDAIDTAGIVTSAGMAIFKDRIPDQDATVARRLKHAGAVLLGKLTTSEGENPFYHPEVTPPVNPWGADRWVSTSAAGIALAARMAYASLSADALGSLRLQAAASGQTGLRPSFGLVSRHGVMPYFPSADHVGIMGRTALDTAMVLSAVAGRDPLDAASLELDVPHYLGALDRPVRELRLGLDRSDCAAVDPVIAEAIERAVFTFRDLGVRIIDVDLPRCHPHLRTWLPLLALPEVALVHEKWFPSMADRYGPMMRITLENGRSLPAMELVRLQQMRAEFVSRFMIAFQGLDAVISPILSTCVETNDEAMSKWLDPEASAGRFEYIAPSGLAGVPCLAFVAGFDPNGMPIGLQLVGPMLSEEMLLRLAHAFQRATDWHTRTPPM